MNICAFFQFQLALNSSMVHDFQRSKELWYFSTTATATNNMKMEAEKQLPEKASYKSCGAGVEPVGTIELRKNHHKNTRQLEKNIEEHNRKR